MGGVRLEAVEAAPVARCWWSTRRCTRCFGGSGKGADRLYARNLSNNPVDFQDVMLDLPPDGLAPSNLRCSLHIA